jgi:hypothetical protein
MLISPSHVPPKQSEKGKKVHEFISMRSQEPNASPRIMRRLYHPAVHNQRYAGVEPDGPKASAPALVRA